MRTRLIAVLMSSVGLLALPIASSAQQETNEAPAEISDVGVIAPAPYDLEPRITLSSAQRELLRKLEDKHIGELRSLEDQYAQDLRALRARQYAERDAILKGFAAK